MKLVSYLTYMRKKQSTEEGGPEYRSDVPFLTFSVIAGQGGNHDGPKNYRSPS